jgi:hypothetical protein
MPQELDVNRENVKMLALQYGCREAARMTGINVNTVLQWSSRFGWFDHLREEPEKPVSMQKQAVIGVIEPSVAMAKAQREDSEASRSAALRISRKTLEKTAELADTEPLKVMAMANDVKSMTSVAASAGNWQQPGTAGTAVAVNILIGNPPE